MASSFPAHAQSQEADAIEKCLSIISSVNSPDPLFGAAEMSAKAMRACMKEDDLNGEARCSLERLELEIRLAKSVDSRKDQPLRAVIYGLLEAAHETMVQMHTRQMKQQQQQKCKQESDGVVSPPPQAVFPKTPMDAVSTTAAILLQPQLLQSIVVKKEKNEPQQQEQPQQEQQLDAVVDAEAVKSTPSLQTAAVLLQPQLPQSRVLKKVKEARVEDEPQQQQQSLQPLDKDAGKEAATPPPQLQTAGILLQPQLRQSRVLKGEKENDETQPQKQQEKAADATLQLQAQAVATSSAPRKKRWRRIPLVACLICQERLPFSCINPHFENIHGQTLSQAGLALHCMRCGVEKRAPWAMYDHAKKKTHCSLRHCIMIEKGKEMGEGEQEQN